MLSGRRDGVMDSALFATETGLQYQELRVSFSQKALLYKAFEANSLSKLPLNV